MSKEPLGIRTTSSQHVRAESAAAAAAAAGGDRTQDARVTIALIEAASVTWRSGVVSSRLPSVVSSLFRRLSRRF